MAEERRSVGGNLPLNSKRAKLYKNGTVTQMFLKEEEDRLSALPDSLLLHILSFLALDEVSRTCVLSKRWEFLWLELSEFDFRGLSLSCKFEETLSFVNWVHYTLSICSGIHLKRFLVSFTYQDKFASSVNFWLHVLNKNKVENVVLDLLPSNSKREFYKLPQRMYFNSSLRNLTLRNCILGGTMFDWKSLKSLSITEVELSESVVRNIVSGCPVLEYLRLIECWGSTSLDMRSRSLRRLVIVLWKGSFLNISAPYVHRLSIKGTKAGYCVIYRLIEISSSLVRAKLDFNRNDKLSKYNVAGKQELMIKSWMQPLCNLQHVEELYLGPWFIEVLSEEMKGLRLPEYSCKHLKLDAFGHVWSILGIIGVLESSPNLETLVVNGLYEASRVKPAPAALTYLRTGDDLNCDLLHLKTVHITDSTGGVAWGEGMLKLIQILLMRANILEKMEINVEVSSSCGTSNRFKISQALQAKKNMIKQALLSYRRSSTKAVIIVT